MVIPPLLYRSLYGGLEESTVFKSLRKYPARTATKDFFVKFHIEVLSVKTWLESKGFFVAWSANCALCPMPETLQHVFLYCTNAEIFWSELRHAFGIVVQPDWVTLKFLQIEVRENRRCIEVLFLLAVTCHLEIPRGPHFGGGKRQTRLGSFC
ncbi:unnamed protein product [Ixodes hexagonus]